uniref:helix-hairpin-helix domain-containing protein n=1 Tax=Bacteroides fragilis TaxID=817 RepID=UPI00356A876E
MLISEVTSRKAKQPMTVIDCFVGKGLEQGGHSALPDIDSDFASDRRQEIKEYLEERYNVGGKQRVFSAGTFSSLKLKAVLKDVARVYRVPVNIVNYITAIFSDEQQDWTDLFMLAATNKKVNKFIHDYPEVIEDIRTIMGQPRSTSIHASAIIVTPEEKDGEPAECFDFLPIRKMDDLLVSEFDGYSVDEIGLLKEDVLATKELSKLGAVINIVNETYQKGYTIESITRDELKDEKTYSLLTKGYTQNVFQFASPGITKFIMDVQPDCIEDLIAINALYRPATLEINATDDYIRYKHGEVAPVYDYGTYEATKNTYGIMVYQEQFMSVAHTLAGFDLGKTDYLRKAIGKKKADLMESLKVDFIKGAISNGCPDYEAETIWHKIETAGKYSFNRSHAAAYALTAYAGAWLKANYPTAFYTVALQWADDKEIPAIMSEMEQCSTAKIVPPDVNVSGIKFFTDYETDEIFWSLSRIKMLGGKSVEYIIAEREKNGLFTSIENFIHRIFRYKLKKYQYWDDPDNEQEATRVPVNALHVRNLIMTGCFDRIENVKAVVERHSLLERAAKELGFKLSDTDFPADLTDKHYFWQMQQVALSGIGSVDYRRIYDNSDAKDKIRGKASYMSLRDALSPDNEGKRIAVCATVAELSEISYKDKTTGEKKKFCKMKLQQNNDLMELVIWNDFYASHKSEISNLKDKMIITTCIVKYSEYAGANSLQNYKTSLLFNV